MQINHQTRVLGLIGAKLSHSLSPLMQNQALEIIKENFVYLAFEVAPGDLASAVEGIRSLGIAGANVTIPYKQMVIPYLDDLDASARDCGAVNVVTNLQGRLVGSNTDGAGFILGLKDAGIEIPQKALLIGGGGAARSVAIELAKCGTREFYILEKMPAASHSLVQMLNSRPGVEARVYVSEQPVFDSLAKEAQLVINCSPAGMFPDLEAAPINDLGALAPGTPVCDLIYNPLETRFLRMARELGLPYLNGVAMLANQGALSLEIWTGQAAPRHKMKDVLIQALKKAGER